MDDPPVASPAARALDLAPHWVWVLVRSASDPPDQVWVRYIADGAPDGLDVRPAAPPRPGSLGVVIVRGPPTITPALSQTPARRKYSPRRPRVGPTDRNLVTVAEFAGLIPCSEQSIHELIKLGLPSMKSPKIGRRVLKGEALAWLISGGARKSRIARKLAKAARGAKAPSTDGAADGSR